MIIIDNFLEKDLIKFLNKICVYETPHFYGHKSHEESNPFYNSGVNLEDNLIKFICKKLKERLKIWMETGTMTMALILFFSW